RLPVPAAVPPARARTLPAARRAVDAAVGARIRPRLTADARARAPDPSRDPDVRRARAVCRRIFPACRSGRRLGRGRARTVFGRDVRTDGLRGAALYP